MNQPKYGLRGKNIKQVSAKFAADEKAREEQKKVEKRQAAEQRVNALRNVIEDLVAGASRNELLEQDMPYITAADALDICNDISSKFPSDSGLRHLKATIYVDYIKDDMKTYTVNEMTRMRNELTRANPSSRVASVIQNNFATASIFQEDFKKYANLASQIKSQKDFEKVLIENGIIGDDMKTFRAQCMIAKLAQLNNEEDGAEMPDEQSPAEDATDPNEWEMGTHNEVETYIPSPNTGEQLKITVESEGDSVEAADGPKPDENGIVDQDPVELLGQLGPVNEVSTEMAGPSDMMPVPQNIEDLPEMPAPEDLVDGQEEGTAVTLEDPSSEDGAMLEIVLDVSDAGEEPGEMHDEPDEDDEDDFDTEDDDAVSDESEEDGEKQAFEDPNHTLRRKLRKLLRRSLGKGRRKKGSVNDARHPCVMYYNANGQRSELDRFRAYNMVDALSKITKYALDSGLEGTVYANSREAAIELDSGNLVTIYLGETDYSKKIASLKYEDAYRYVRNAGVNLGDAENKVLDGNPISAYGYKLAFNSEGEYEFSYKGSKIRTADVMNFRPLLKDFVMQAAVEHLKHAQDEELMNEIDREVDLFTEDSEGGDAGLEMVELDNGLVAEVEKNGPQIQVLTVRDSNGNELEVTPEIEEEAMAKYQMGSSSVEEKLAKLGGIDAFTFKCASCNEYSTVPMPEEACNLDCSSCGMENTRGQIIASIKDVEQVDFNYLFKVKHAKRIASNLEDRGLYTDVINGMLHIAEDSLNEDEVLMMIEEEIGELEKEADGPMGGDGQGAGPQYPNMMPNQNPGAPVPTPPGAVQNMIQDVQYDTGTASPNQQRDDPGGVGQEEMKVGQMPADHTPDMTTPIKNYFDPRKIFKFDNPNESRSNSQNSGNSDNSGTFVSASKKAYRVAYILDGKSYTNDVSASSQFAIRSYFSKYFPNAFIKSAQELDELPAEGEQTPERYFEEYMMANDMLPESVDYDDLLQYLTDNAAHIMYDVEPYVWWSEQNLNEEELEDLQEYFELYFEEDDFEVGDDDASLELDPLSEDMSFLDERSARVAQEEEADMMPVPKSAPEAEEPEDVGEESTFNLEQPVDAEGAEEIKSAFMYYRHEGLGPAEAIKKFMTEYDDENFDQSEVIRICGTVYAGDPLTQSLDLQNLVPGGTNIEKKDLQDEVVASLKQASKTESSLLKAVLKVASKHPNPLGVIRIAAKSLSSFDGKGYSKKQHHSMDMSLKSPKAFAGVTSKKVNGEGKFPKSDNSLKSDQNYAKAFGKVDSKGVSGDPTSGGKENAMNAKDVLKGDKAGNNHFKSVNSKSVSGDPTSGNKEGANTKHMKSLKDDSQKAFSSVNSKSVGREEIAGPKTDTGSRSLKAYAQDIKRRIASMKKTASPEMASEIQELQMLLNSVQKIIKSLKSKVVKTEPKDLGEANIPEGEFDKDEDIELPDPTYENIMKERGRYNQKAPNPWDHGPDDEFSETSTETPKERETFSPENEEFLRRMEQRERRRDRRRNRYSSQDISYEDLD